MTNTLILIKIPEKQACLCESQFPLVFEVFCKLVVSLRFLNDIIETDQCVVNFPLCCLAKR